LFSAFLHLWRIGCVTYQFSFPSFCLLYRYFVFWLVVETTHTHNRLCSVFVFLPPNLITKKLHCLRARYEICQQRKNTVYTWTIERQSIKLTARDNIKDDRTRWWRSLPAGISGHALVSHPTDNDWVAITSPPRSCCPS